MNNNGTQYSKMFDRQLNVEIARKLFEMDCVADDGQIFEAVNRQPGQKIDIRFIPDYLGASKEEMMAAISRVKGDVKARYESKVAGRKDLDGRAIAIAILESL